MLLFHVAELCERRHARQRDAAGRAALLADLRGGLNQGGPGVEGNAALGIAATAPALALALALAAAFLNAAFGFCLGCEMYLLVTRLRKRAA